MSEAAPVKAKTQESANKVLLTVLELVQHFARSSNHYAACYCKLLKEIKLAYCQKRRDQAIREIILLHDNAKPYTAAVTQQLQKIVWTPLEHPPYSPDLSPCDFHVFGPLKEALESQ